MQMGVIRSGPLHGPVSQGNLQDVQRVCRPSYNGVESGAIPSTPHNLANALDEAW